MIRAVSRYTLEINRTGSPYFDRAICFVKPEFAQSDRLDLHRAAQQLISTFDAGVEEQTAFGELYALQSGDDAGSREESSGKRISRMVMRLLPLALAAAAGAGVTLLVMLLV